MKLIIFDLDQTLVDLISIHNEATRKLFRNYFGVDASLNEIDFAGKSITDIFVELATLKKVSADLFQRESKQLLKSYENYFNEKLPKDASKYILPGAKELLSALVKTDHFITLYTGNSQNIVRSVLTVTNLKEYFRLCLFGTEVKNRVDMVSLAVEKAEKLTGEQFRDKGIVVVGDSTRDIECGKAFNALTIAVATGFHSRTQLSALGPDYLFDSLKDWRKILRIIM